MVLQWPVEGADDPTMSMNCWKSMSPAACRSRAFQTIVPEPVSSLWK